MMERETIYTDGRDCYIPPLTTLAQVELESALMATSVVNEETTVTIERQGGMHGDSYTPDGTGYGSASANGSFNINDWDQSIQ